MKNFILLIGCLLFLVGSVTAAGGISPPEDEQVNVLFDHGNDVMCYEAVKAECFDIDFVDQEVLKAFEHPVNIVPLIVVDRCPEYAEANESWPLDITIAFYHPPNFDTNFNTFSANVNWLWEPYLPYDTLRC